MICGMVMDRLLIPRNSPDRLDLLRSPSFFRINSSVNIVYGIICITAQQNPVAAANASMKSVESVSKMPATHAE
jgi:hypothetical protein